MKKLGERFCDICGVSSNVKRVCFNKQANMNLCEKHRDQFRRFGKFMDKNQRGVYDPNEIRLFSDYAEIDTYDKYGNVLETYLLDLDDIDKLDLSKTKWRTSYKRSKPYLVTGNKAGEITYFHRLVINTSNQIDHINGDTHNNRKINLREVTIQQNMLNLQKKSNNTSGIRGVSFNKKKNTWKCDFTYNKKRLYVKEFLTKEQAIYLRYLMEQYYLKEYRNIANDKSYLDAISSLTQEQKVEIEQYFEQRKKYYESKGI